MSNILYAEYKDYENEKNTSVNHQKNLTEKLTKEGIDFILLGKNSKEKKEIVNIFNKDVRPILEMYNILIAHVGVDFQDQIEPLLNAHPKLKIALVTDFPGLYHKEHNNRLLVCGYNSNKLIDFIKEEL
ncbi:MAG: hypothetical protein Q7S33_04115 [Nanoarchaeota archaeon]|nr:hypothetical protein [Nanoarchaeota archaeon]